MSRSSSILIRCTPEERVAIHAAAAARGVPVSELMRSLALAVGGSQPAEPVPVVESPLASTEPASDERPWDSLSPYERVQRLLSSRPVRR
jgi:hypothetical protein